ncbi:hypothetical protein RFI_14909, partial [Reticulomyxa filosa]
AGQARGDYCLVFASSAFSVLCSKKKALKNLMAFVLCIALEESCHDPLPMSGIEALDFGTANYMPTNAIGVGFNDQLSVSAVKDLGSLFNHLREHKGHYITSPYALRFSKLSNGTICSAYQKVPCAWIEMPLLDFNKTYSKIWHNLVGDTAGAHDTYAEAFDLMLGEKYQSIVHWGLWFAVNDSIWKNISSNDFQSFVDNYKHFNAEKFFCNPFTEKSGLDKTAFST